MIKLQIQPHTYAVDESKNRYVVPNRNAAPGILYVDEAKVQEFLMYQEAMNDGFYLLTIVYSGNQLRYYLVSLDEKVKLEQLLDKKSDRLEKVPINKGLRVPALED